MKHFDVKVDPETIRKRAERTSGTICPTTRKPGRNASSTELENRQSAKSTRLWSMEGGTGLVMRDLRCYECEAGYQGGEEKKSRNVGGVVSCGAGRSALTLT